MSSLSQWWYIQAGNAMSNGMVFNIQKYSIQDGPGIRSTVFLKGCPLRCWWCHNPESLSPRPEIVVLEARCRLCGDCVRACPNRATRGENVGIHYDFDACKLCGACVEACPSHARQIVGTRMSVPEVMAEVLKDRIFYDESGGGVTFSGGEPLMQPRFLKSLLIACRSQGVPTAVDTCGFGSRDFLMSIAPLTDLFLYDLKAIDDAKHLMYTGVSNASILDNLSALGQVHSNIWIRIPYVPELNDDDGQLEATARFVASIPGVRQANLLPYHKTAVHKFRRLGRSFKLEHVTDPSPDRLEEVRQKLSTFGLSVKIGG
ncbi:MAG TPA: glycyl-radical enzyme activating protein [Acidobacteriota bacterium]|nr:glycyl-radical enzyme activating protein [Acidobacteriota bacterium]